MQAVSLASAAVRNLGRRKLRTLLTILGIAAGSLALTMMGALSERLNTLVAGAARYYNTRIVVQPRIGMPGQLFGPLLSSDVADAIRTIPGVAAAFPTTYSLVADPDSAIPSITFGLPPLVIGVDAARFSYARERDPIPVAEGRLFVRGERGVAVLGSDLARPRQLHLGQSLRLHGREFKIVGVLEQTLTVRDNMAILPLRDAQELLAASLPPPFNLHPESLASEIEVYALDLDRTEEIVKAINSRIDGVRASPPGEIERRFRQGLLIFTAIAISSAIIAAAIGALFVFNTMAMAVAERTAEIGVKKAIGAANVDIALEFLVEAITMGVIGSILGFALGAILIELFAAVAGLYPALLAARRSPADALRVT
jgi:putative ABC transport system permease protein